MTTLGEADDQQALGLEHTVRPEGRPPKLGYPVSRPEE